MPNNPINTQVWLNTQTGQADGAGPGSDDTRQLDVERAINMGIDVYTPGGGIDIQGAGAFSGGKTGYDVGTGFWLGCDEDTLKYEVAIGNPNSNTFNFDGEYIDAQMRNLELTGWLRGPSTFTIDPATHGDNTGTVVIAGNLQVDGTTTTVNSTVVEIDDIAILIGAEATTATLANNGGIILGTFTNNPFILYRNSYDAWEVNKDWTPNVNNSKDLGNTTYRWRNLYLSGNANIQGSLEVDGNVDLGSDTADTITMTGRVDSSIIPNTNNAHNLGSSALRWANIYADNGDFSGNLDVDGDATIGGTITSTGNISSPNMADDLTATVSGSNININLVANNNSVLGSVALAPGSNITLSEASDIITIASTQVQSDWNQTTSTDPAFIKNKPTIPAPQVNSDWNATSGLAEILNKPTIITPVQSDWNETTSSNLAFIKNKPYLVDDLDSFTDTNVTPNEVNIRLLNSNSQVKGSVVLDPGTGISITESANRITISSTVLGAVQSDWNETSSTDLAFIKNKPTIPAAQVNSDWDATSGVAEILNKPTIPTTVSSLTDVTLTSLLNGDVLKYNSTSQEWENVRDAVVTYSVSPSPCGHYYVDILEKGDLVVIQASLHIAQEASSTNTWTSTIQAPAGGSVPVPGNSIAVGTAMTTGTSSMAAYRTYVAQIDQSGVIKIRSTEPATKINTFTSTSTSSTVYTLSAPPRDNSENNTMVHINGVYQPKSAYTITAASGSSVYNQLTIATPNTGDSIEVITKAAPTFATVDEVKAAGANFIFINIAFIK